MKMFYNSVVFAVAVIWGTMFAVSIVSCKNESLTESKQHSGHVEEIGGMPVSNLEKAADYAEGSGIIIKGSPYPNSSVISNIIWDHRENIIRKGFGSDNWPLTWADDNNIYAAFGDGYGFEPRLQSKVSFGLAKISGNSPNISASNIQLANQIYGNGKLGKKASGLLMVDGTLFVWMRNANEKGEGSQLAWSSDHGKTLQWCKWIFDQLGYCTFVNYSKDYIGARDKYIYSVSHNSPSAYRRADSFVLMRVPIDKVLTRSAYEFFKELDEKNNPVWTTNIDERGAVFEDKGRCYRSGISYNPGLKRYFWWQAKFVDRCLPIDIDTLTGSCQMHRKRKYSTLI
jgi:hypothetical protein